MTTVSTTDPLVSFLYILLRDHLPAGKLEMIFREHLDPSVQIRVLSNGYLAEYAEELAIRLRKP